MHKRQTGGWNGKHQLYRMECSSVEESVYCTGHTCPAPLSCAPLQLSRIPLIAPHIAKYKSSIQVIVWYNSRIMFTYFLNLGSYSEPQACITVRPCTSQTLDQSGPGSLLDLGPARPGAHIEAPTTYLILKLRNFSPLRRFFETDSHSRKKQLNIQNPLWWSELNSELFDF